MNKPVTDLKPDVEIVDPLAKLREPFTPNQISKLPKESRAQSDERKADRKTAINCQVCGGWHHRNAVHLDYVGHAAATDRLLDADIRWAWEPLALTPDGLPAFDRNGGLWIKLTVDGVTRIGYGAADGKTGGDAVKEIIGDALRNAGMRFGMALDLWHKGQLHVEEEGPPPPSLEEKALNLLRGASADRGLLKEAWETNKGAWKSMLDREAYGRLVGEVSRLVEALPKDEPPPPKADPFGLDGDDVPEFN